MVEFIYGDGDDDTQPGKCEMSANRVFIPTDLYHRHRRCDLNHAKIPKIMLFACIALSLLSFMYVRINPLSIATSLPRIFAFIRTNFLPPNFVNLPSTIHAVRATLYFAIVGTYISVFFALILGILMTKEMNPFPPLRAFVRFFVSVLRNIPLLIIAQIMIFIFGIGTINGIMALVFATLGFLSRSYAESIDEIAGTKLEAIRSTGAGYLQILFHGLVPEFIPAWINWTLFSFEINIRASAVLGMVGAGGLGLLIQTNLDLRSFRRAAALIIILVAMVLVTELLINLLRHLIQKNKSTPRHPVFGTVYSLVCGVSLISVFLFSFNALGLNFQTFASRLRNAGHVLSRFMVFDVSALPAIFRQLLVSVALGVCGVVIGCGVSFILAFLAAGNTAPLKPVSWVIKGAVGLIRAVPSLVLILIIVAILGFGNNAAVVGLMLSSIGYLTKAFIGTIEEQDHSVIETMQATGAGWLQTVVHGILPGVFTAFMSWIALRLESNIADSISFGVVGAGGIGLLVSRAARQHNFPMLTTAIIVIIAAMAVLEFCVGRMKKLLT